MIAYETINYNVRYCPNLADRSFKDCRLSERNDQCGTSLLTLRKRDAVALNILEVLASSYNSCDILL